MNTHIYDFDTGDILLFSNKNWWRRWGILDRLIQFFTRSRFDHVAMIVKNPNFGPEQLDGLYVLESTGFENEKDVEDGEIKFGVQLRFLDEILQTTDQQIFWRKLTCARDEKFKENLKKAHSVVHNRGYDINPIDWICANFNIRLGDVNKKTTFFCSALVAFIYTSLGLLKENTPWTIIRPVDFSENEKEKRIEFQNCFLENEIQIK